MDLNLEKTIQIRVMAIAYDDLIPKALDRVAAIAYGASVKDGKWVTPDGARVRGQVIGDAELSVNSLCARVQVGLEPPF